VEFATVASALAEFRGAERRFEQHGVVGGVTVVDDYGHHPTELAAVLAAARAAKPARVILAFQPHRYTRTRDLMSEFADVLSTADEVVLTDIYPASEDPIPGVTIDALAQIVGERRGARVHVVPVVADVPAAVASIVRAGDLVLTLGAGSIGGVAAALVAELERRQGGKVEA
jgi:UDP-N-acetylmuramate--alanine ligase